MSHVSAGSNMMAIDDRLYMPLHLAAQLNNCAIAELLIRKGAKIESLAPNGLTPLYVCAEYNAASMAKLLVDNGASLEARYWLDKALRRDGTALHCAVRNQSLAVARFLVTKVANTEAKNDNGETPRSIASGREGWEFLQTG
jgi:ankyrin repeat protein